MGTGPVIAMSGLNAATDAGLELAGIAGFDITPEIIDAIEAGEIAFTIDQQQYLQGYLPILLLYLNVTNQNTARRRPADPHRARLRRRRRTPAGCGAGRGRHPLSQRSSRRV